MTTEWTEFQLVMLCFYSTLLLTTFLVIAFLFKEGVRDIGCYFYEVGRSTGVWIYLTISMVCISYGMQYFPATTASAFLLIVVFVLVRNVGFRKHLLGF